jgi:serine protease Do
MTNTPAYRPQSLLSNSYSVLSTKYAVLGLGQMAIRLLSLALGFLCCSAILRAQDDLASEEEQSIRTAIQRIAPSVVKIETIGGLERVGKVLVSTGPTTGLVVADNGYVISSAFNFIQQPSSILVTLPSGARAPAQIVARDHSRMLVLLKVNAKEKLTVPEAVPHNQMTVGQWAIAVGRTYEQPEPNLSVGLVSATGRIWSTAIQTDAKVSPANYGGPLIDIQGRVLGVLVPLSPQRQGGEIAGAEWYDSGIGFAIPLVDIYERLATLQGGKDLYPGVMGISLKAGDQFSLPAELAATQPASPSYKAGLRAGDTIVQLDSVPITRQVQLRHVLGPRYAGDKVHVTYLRGKENPERREVDIELTDKLIPYEHPFLGVLPLRDGAGVRVRYVYDGSPAAAAGVKAGDAIVAIGETAVTDANQLRLLVANLEPKEKTSLQVSRGGETLTLQWTPAKLPTAIPGELPPAIAEPPVPPDQQPKTGVVEIKLPEEKNECAAYVPDTYHPQVPHGLVVVLSSPGKVDREKLAARWKAVCEERQLIVLAPVSAAADKWQATETEFVKKTIDDCVANYNIDPARIAVYGFQTGGSMAYLVGVEQVERVRAIIAIDALPPPRTKLAGNDPINRLAFFLGQAEKSAAAAGLKQLISILQAAKFPVTQKAFADQPRDLNDDELRELARWLDALDRI